MTVVWSVNQGDPLSDRELEVLRALANGLGNNEIAAHLLVSLETVKSHVRRLLLKLGAANRAHAVALAYEQGVLVAEGEAA